MCIYHLYDTPPLISLRKQFQKCLLTFKIPTEKLTPAQLRKREATLEDTVFDSTTNPYTVFNDIQQFQTLCQLVGKGKTDSQLVDIAYIIFQKSGIFMEPLMQWNKRTATNNYEDFKTFIQEEYNASDAVGGLTVGNSSLHQANAVQELKDHQQHLTEELKKDLHSSVKIILQTYNISSNQDDIPQQYDSFTIPSPDINYPSAVLSSYLNPFQQKQMLYSTQNSQLMQPLQELTNIINQI